MNIFGRIERGLGLPIVAVALGYYRSKRMRAETGD
jgi:hypothetical protein